MLEDGMVAQSQDPVRGTQSRLPSLRQWHNAGTSDRWGKDGRNLRGGKKQKTANGNLSGAISFSIWPQGHLGMYRGVGRRPILSSAFDETEPTTNTEEHFQLWSGAGVKAAVVRWQNWTLKPLECLISEMLFCICRSFWHQLLFDCLGFERVTPFRIEFCLYSSPKMYP